MHKNNIIIFIALFLCILIFINHSFCSSLWISPCNNEWSMFSDKVARSKGDILTVIVNEEFETTIEYEIDLKKDKDEVNNFITQLIYPKEVSGIGTHRGFLPRTVFESSRKHKSENSNSSTVELKDLVLSVKVMDVLPNGNLVLAGYKELRFTGQSFCAVLTGIVRQYDILNTNQVPSNLLLDAKIHIIPEGDITNMEKQSLLMRLEQLINAY